MKPLSWLSHFIIHSFSEIAEFFEHFLDYINHTIQSAAFHLVHSVMIIKCAILMTESARKLHQLHTKKKTKNLLSKSIKTICLSLCVIGVVASIAIFLTMGTELAFAVLVVSQVSLMAYHSWRYSSASRKYEKAHTSEDQEKYRIKTHQRLNQLKNASMGTILCSAIVISSLFFPALTLTTLAFAMAISTVHIIHMAQHFHQNRMTYLNVEQPDEEDVINQLKNRLDNLKELTNQMTTSLDSDHHKLFKPLDNHEIKRMKNNSNLNDDNTEEEHESIGGPS